MCGLLLAKNSIASGPPPVITVQPLSISVPLLGIATFGVTVSSQTTLTYQWFRNGSPISGANSSKYILLSVLGSDSGTYYVAITNGGGSAISSSAYLNSGPPPLITIQPESQTVSRGQNVSLSVMASNSLPLMYQWYFGHSQLGGNSSGSNLVLNKVSSTNAGAYSVVVSCTFGSITSAVANITVTNPVIALSASTGAGMGTTSSGFTFHFSVPVGQNFVVQASSDLLNWVSISTNVATSASVAVLDAGAASVPKRYYRVMVP